MANRIVFEYELSGSMSLTRSIVTVTADGVASYGAEVDIFDKDALSVTRLKPETLEKLKNAVAACGLTGRTQFEYVPVCDGYTNTVKFGKTELAALNLSFCTDEPDMYPNNYKLIELIRKARAILSADGIPAECLALCFASDEVEIED